MRSRSVLSSPVPIALPLVLSALAPVACRGAVTEPPPRTSEARQSAEEPTPAAPPPERTLGGAGAPVSSGTTPPPPPSDAQAGALDPVRCETPGPLDRFAPGVRSTPTPLTAPFPFDQASIDDSWSHEPDLDRFRKAPLVALGQTHTVAAGAFVKVRVPAGHAVVVDLQAQGGASEAALLALGRGQPRNDLFTERLSEPRQHWITVLPRLGQGPVDEVALSVREGTMLVHLTAIPVRKNGDLAFPVALALGREPLGTAMNCGPEQLYDTGEQVDSARTAIERVRDLYLDLGGPMHGLDTCRISRARGPRRAEDIDWQGMEKRVRVAQLGARTVYDLTYSVDECGEDTFAIRITSDGWLSHFGCCGK